MPRKVKMHSGCKGQEEAAMRPSLYAPAPPCRCKQLVDYDEANKLVKRGEASWVVTGIKAVVKVEVDCPLCANKTEAEKKTLVVCGDCKGTGKVTESREILSYNNDIVLLSSIAVDPKNKRHRWNTRNKTPRVPTIEAKHIDRAFVVLAKNPDEFREVKRKQPKRTLPPRDSGITVRDMEFAYHSGIPFEDNYAAQRIEEYGQMSQEVLAGLGAELKTIDPATWKIEIVKEGKLEPANTRIAHPPGSITFKDGTTNKSWWWEEDGRDVDYGRAM